MNKNIFQQFDYQFFQNKSQIKTKTNRCCIESCIFCSACKSYDQMMKKRLYNTYSQSQNYYYSRDINTILVNLRSKIAIKVKDLQFYDEDDEYLKRFYQQKEFKGKMKILLEYYKHNFHFPRLFMQPTMVVISRYIDKKRRLEYIRISRLWKSQNNNVNKIQMKKFSQPIQDKILEDMDNDKNGSLTIQELNLKLGQIIKGDQKFQTFKEFEINESESDLENFLKFLDSSQKLQDTVNKMMDDDQKNMIKSENKQEILNKDNKQDIVKNQELFQDKLNKEISNKNKSQKKQEIFKNINFEQFQNDIKKKIYKQKNDLIQQIPTFIKKNEKKIETTLKQKPKFQLNLDKVKENQKKIISTQISQKDQDNSCNMITTDRRPSSRQTTTDRQLSARSKLLENISQINKLKLMNSNSKQNQLIQKKIKNLTLFGNQTDRTKSKEKPKVKKNAQDNEVQTDRVNQQRYVEKEFLLLKESLKIKGDKKNFRQNSVNFHTRNYSNPGSQLKSQHLSKKTIDEIYEPFKQQNFQRENMNFQERNRQDLNKIINNINMQFYVNGKKNVDQKQQAEIYNYSNNNIVNIYLNQQFSRKLQKKPI